MTDITRMSPVGPSTLESRLRRPPTALSDLCTTNRAAMSALTTTRER